MKMKRIVAMLSAAVLVSGCTLFHLQDNEIRHDLLVHAASVEDLTFQIVTAYGDNQPDYSLHEGDTVTTMPYSSRHTTIPDGMTSYQYAILKKCDSYASGVLEIPQTYQGAEVKVIDKYAFSGCYELTRVIIPDEVVTMGSHVFDGCSGLNEVILPNKLNEIPEMAFWSCKSLDAISIPESVVSIGKGAFSGCTSLKNVVIPNSVSSFGGKGVSTYEGVFYRCNSLETVTLSESITVIPDFSFGSCEKLRNITIPENVTNIRKNSFSSCNALESITILNSECTINELWENAYSFAPTIYGIVGSTAETYAKEHNLTFKPLEDAPPPEQNENAPPPEQNENTLPLAPEGSVFGDVDGDEDVTVADAQAVLQFYVKIMAGKTPSWSEVTGNANAPS